MNMSLSLMRSYECAPLNRVSVPGISVGDVVWFKAISVLDHLGYASNGIKTFERHVKDKEHYRQLKDLDKTQRFDMEMWFVDEYVIKMLITRGRKTKCKDLAPINGIKVLTRYEPKETEILSRFCKIFEGMGVKAVEQYKVKYVKDRKEYAYKIDMYLIDLKIAIEVDENGHRDRPSINEVERQELIEKQLKCRFYRIDPDKADFNLDTEIGSMIKFIYG